MQILIWLTSNHWTTWRSTTRWTRTFEGLRGARMFHLVSLSLGISLADLPGPCLGLCVGVACFWLVLFLVGFFLPGKFDFNLMLIPVVDRPCLALVRQCRKKKTTDPHILPCPSMDTLVDCLLHQMHLMPCDVIQPYPRKGPGFNCCR